MSQVSCRCASSLPGWEACGGAAGLEVTAGYIEGNADDQVFRAAGSTEAEYHHEGK